MKRRKFFALVVGLFAWPFVPKIRKTVNRYVGCWLRVGGNSRRIVDYDATTKLATIDTCWATVPDATSTYSLELGGIGKTQDD